MISRNIMSQLTRNYLKGVKKSKKLRSMQLEPKHLSHKHKIRNDA